MVFDVGGTNIKYSVMDEAGEVLSRGEVSTPRSDLVSFLSEITRIHDEAGVGTSGIAMSLPGIIDTCSGYCVIGGALAYNYGQQLGYLLGEACGCRSIIANDAKCAAMAELRLGSLRGSRNCCVYLMGTAVGGALVMDGKLQLGARGAAGEFSFISTGLSDWEDIHSYVGTVASTSGLLRMMRLAKGMDREDLRDGRAAFSLIDSGDQVACRVFREFCDRVALQLYNISVLLDLERIAIGGGISDRGDVINGIRAALLSLHERLPQSLKVATRVPDVVRCKFGSNANQVGAFLVYKDVLESDAEMVAGGRCVAKMPGNLSGGSTAILNKY